MVNIAVMTVTYELSSYPVLGTVILLVVIILIQLHAKIIGNVKLATKT